MSGDGVNTYNWNARDQLSSVIKTGQTLPSFIYDAFGRRQKKTLGATVTSYLYDGTNAVQELTNGTPSANMLTGLGVDEVFQRSESAATRTFLSDALGSTLALADTSGVVQTSYTYAPYGETTVTGTTSTNTTQYTGRENDNDGLYFYRARYYHPVFSRFVSEDPIGFGGGDANLYRYVNSNPTNMTDPTGNCPICVVVLVAWMIADAHDLFLSGRKHSKAEYALFAVNLTPIGRIGRAIGLTSEAARAAVQTARGLQKAWTHLEKAGLLTKWSGKTSPAQISSMLRGILENPIAVADDVLYKTPVKVFLGEFRDAPIAVFVSQETGKVVSAFVPSVERFMRLFVK
jgi:RHS repeat-associated protein